MSAGAPRPAAPWLFAAIGVALLAGAWIVPLPVIADAMRHPVRVNAAAAALQAATWARLGASIAAFTLAVMPWMLLDARTSLQPPSRAPRRWLWLAMLLAVALRFGMGTQGLWYDEIASLGTYVVHGPGVIAGNAFTTANHPLQSLLSWCCLPLGVEPWIRLPSMLSGAVAVLGAWLIGRATRQGTSLATAMAFAVAVMPAAVNAGSEARGYGLMIASSALSTGLLLQAWRHGGSWRWIAYVLVLALGVWAHFVTAMVGAGHALVAIMLLRRKSERVIAIGTLVSVACAALLALALWSPALPDLLRARAQFAALRGNEPSLFGPQGWLLLWQLVGMTPLPMHVAGIDHVRAVLTGVPAAALLIAGLLACRRDHTLRRALALAGAGLPVAVLLAWIGGSWLYARFLLFAVPACALLLALGTLALVQRDGPRASRLSLAGIVPLMALVMALAYDLSAGPRQPIREAVAQVAERRAPDDHVLGIGIADDVVQWYAMAFDVPIQPTGVGGERLPDTLARCDARWIVALYPRHRHPNATADALSRLGFHRQPEPGLMGWLDAGEGTVEVWERQSPQPVP